MTTIILFIICVAWLDVVCSESVTVPYIKPCHIADTACLVSSAQDAVPVIAAGIPSMGMNPMEPLLIDEMQADHAGLSMDFRNTSIKGFSKTSIIDLRRQKHSVSLKMRLSLVLFGDYNLKGKILLLPIEGEGKYKITIRNISVNIMVYIDERVADKERFWDIRDWKFTTESPSNVRFMFQNLFNGNRRLSQPVLKFANENWKEVFREVSSPIVKAIVDRIVQELRKFFDRVPIKELDLE